MECINIYNMGGSGDAPPSTITSISPSTWVVGHSYKVLVTGVFTGNASQAAVGGGCDFSEAWVNGSSYVSITNYGEPSAFISSTQMMFDVKVKDGASSGTYDFSMTCDGNCPVATAPVQIKGCADETIASVSPNIWFAGKAYKTTITGTNFITKEKATKLCPVSKVDATATSSNVAVSDVTVVSDTQITATIKPDKDSPAEQGTVTVDSETSNTTIIDNEIQWNNWYISAGIYSTGAQQAVVGQQILLTTNPNLPANITITDSTWTVGGTRIADYPASSTGPTSVTQLTDNDLKKPNITFYWVYPKDSIPITYKYCVDIPGLSADDIASKLNCGLPAKATFDVAGPTGGIIPQPTSWGITPALSNCYPPPPTLQLLQFGQISGGTSCAEQGTPGITFTAEANSQPSGGGAISFVQILLKNNTTTIPSSSGATPSINTGLDNYYPYATGNVAQDSPGNGLEGADTRVHREFKAQMYEMWTSSNANSIPVPLGSVIWQIDGTAILEKGVWTLDKGSTGSANGFAPARNSDPKTHGYPTWTNVVLNTH
jgi:hypothetical protein